MNILIDIGHPAHVHLFRNLYFELEKRGHKVVVTAKDVPAITELLKKYGIDFINLGVKKDGITGKVFSQLKFNYLIWNIVKKEKIDIALGTSVSVAQVSRWSKMKSIVLDDDDDDVEPFFVKYVHPFCDTLLSPDVLAGKRKRKDTVYYAGLHELAYLHPHVFKPDISVLEEAGLSKDEQFFILRFNVFKAYHDADVYGLSLKQKLELVEMLKPYGKILITTERDIEPELEEYHLRLSPEKIHSLLYYSTLFIGDSQTMASEAAVLGTPSVRCNTLAGKIAYLDEEEQKYRLTFAFKPEAFNELRKKLKELLSIPDLKEVFRRRREKLLTDKIDVTTFLVWFVEHYPESVEIMKADPVFQERFRS